MRAAVALTLIAAACLTASALAQDSATPAGNYGGGSVVAPPRSVFGAGNMLIGLRATRDGVLQINAGVTLSCSQDALFSARVTPAADGSFSVKGARDRRTGDGARVLTTYRLSGTVAGSGASGRASARNTITRGGRTTRCPTSKVRWRARRSTGDVGTPPPAPKTRLNGTTSQRLDGPRRAITLRVSSDGRRLTRALYDVTVRCGDDTVTDTYDSPKRNLPIAADGAVRDVERFEFRSRRTVYRSVERFTATIGAAGARGTFSTTARIADRRSGRTMTRCRSGTVRWTAAR